jgi:hypothetical protein
MLATILLVLLIVVFGTAVPFPLFISLRESLEPVPPLIDVVRPYIAALIVLGSRISVLAVSAIASVCGWETAQPPAIDAWLLAAQRIGAIAGLVLAAVLPAWVLVAWSRQRLRLPNMRPAPLRAFPLAIAIVWTAIVSQPLVSLVGTALFPVDTWLMLPSASQAAEAPAPGWCAFQLHPSVFACEAERLAANARKDETVNGYAFAGARCVSAAEIPHPDCEPAAAPAPAPASAPAPAPSPTPAS